MCPLPQRTDAEQRDRLFSTHWDDPALAGWSDALYTIAGYVLYTTNSTYLTWQVRRRMTYSPSLRDSIYGCRRGSNCIIGTFATVRLPHGMAAGGSKADAEHRCQGSKWTPVTVKGQSLIRLKRGAGHNVVGMLDEHVVAPDAIAEEYHDWRGRR